MRETMKFFALLIGTCLWASIVTARRRGEEIIDSSEQISSIMGIDGGYMPEDQEFVDRFLNATFTEPQRLNMLDNLQPMDLVEFVRNAALSSYKTKALTAYGLNYGLWPLYLNNRTNDADLTVYKGEIVFKSFDIFKEFVVPIQTKTKALVVDFKSLSFENSTVASKLEEGIQLINDTGIAAILQKLELRGVFGKEYEVFDNYVFGNVQELSLVDCFLYYYEHENPNAGDGNMKLKDGYLSYKPETSFPKVTRLSIEMSEFSDFNWIKTHYTKLTHLNVDASTEHYFTNKEILEAVTANPSLNTLGVIGCSLDLLREIGKTGSYPGIKTLGLKGFTGDFRGMRANIQIDDIERFYFTEETPTRNVKILQFPKLKELYWRSTEKPATKLFRILSTHDKQLKKLTIDNSTLTNDELKKMANMDNLEEINFIFHLTDPIAMTGAGFAQFIADNNKPNSKLELVRLFTKDQAFLTAVDTAMNALPTWREHISNPPDFEKTVYVKAAKTPDNYVDSCVFFNDYF